jgi:Flp pilus assembly protein TadB
MTADATWVAALGGGLALAGIAGLVVPPTPRLAHRVRPYAVVARARLRGDADVAATAAAPRPDGAWAGTFLPPLRALVRSVARVAERRDDAVLELALQQAGMVEVTAGDHRTRVALDAVRAAAAGTALGIVVIRSAPATLALVTLGAVWGAARARGRLERAIADRAERIRLELYTVNQLLAMHIRSGAGPMQAVQRVVDRGAGAVVDELQAVLLSVRRGASEPGAFRHAAAITPEPAAARTYKLFAAGAERGVDLAGGLRALSEDLRDARREELRQTATKRRAAMLVPTIAVLAPVMLLFVAAPLPSLVFGAR